MFDFLITFLITDCKKKTTHFGSRFENAQHGKQIEDGLKNLR